MNAYNILTFYDICQNDSIKVGIKQMNKKQDKTVQGIMHLQY